MAILSQPQCVKHGGIAIPYGVTEPGQHWFRSWHVTFSTPSHHLEQCLVIMNWTHRNTLQWNLNKIYYFSLKKMHLKMLSERYLSYVQASISPHWGHEKMATIFLWMSFLNAFSSIKILVYQFKFHWNLFAIIDQGSLLMHIWVTWPHSASVS